MTSTAKNPLKVGDRVRVYSGTARYVGVIESAEGGVVFVHIKGSGGIYFSPKQCRRLKPKAKRRRVWIPEVALDAIQKLPFNNTRRTEVSLNKMIPEDVEFIEVRKKGK